MNGVLLNLENLRETNRQTCGGACYPDDFFTSKGWGRLVRFGVEKDLFNGALTVFRQFRVSKGSRNYPGRGVFVSELTSLLRFDSESSELLLFAGGLSSSTVVIFEDTLATSSTSYESIRAIIFNVFFDCCAETKF